MCLRQCGCHHLGKTQCRQVSCSRSLKRSLRLLPRYYCYSLSLGSILALIRLGRPVKPEQRDEPKLEVYGAIHKQNEVLKKLVFGTIVRRAVDVGP